jgi:hypothetical protein
LQVVTSEQRPASGTTGLLQTIRAAQGERPTQRLRKPRPAKPGAPSRKEAPTNSN